MADKVKTTNQLKLVAAFTDGDDRTLALDNPKSGLTKADIVGTEDAAKVAIIGDKTGATFKEWKSAKIVKQETHYLDLTVE